MSPKSSVHIARPTKMAFDTEHIIIKTPSFLRGSFNSLPMSRDKNRITVVLSSGTSRKLPDCMRSSFVRSFVSPYMIIQGTATESVNLPIKALACGPIQPLAAQK